MTPFNNPERRRITRRLRGLGFEEDGEGRWIRHDAAGRRNAPHRGFGWCRGCLVVLAREDQLLLHTFQYEWVPSSAPLRSMTRVPGKETLIFSCSTLGVLVDEIQATLDRKRVRGKLPTWWHQPAERHTAAAPLTPGDDHERLEH